MTTRNESIVPTEVVEKIVETLLAEDNSVCECRRSPFDKHDVNPPCSTRKEMTRQVLLTLNMASPYMQG